MRGFVEHEVNKHYSVSGKCHKEAGTFDCKLYCSNCTHGLSFVGLNTFIKYRLDFATSVQTIPKIIFIYYIGNLFMIIMDRKMYSCQRSLI